MHTRFRSALLVLATLAAAARVASASRALRNLVGIVRCS